MRRRSIKQASSGGWHDGARRLARGICLLVLALLAATISLTMGNRHSIGSLHDANATQIVLPIGFGLLGALTTSREPANRLGWLSLGMAAAMAMGGLTDQYARWALATNPSAPYTPWIPLIGHVSQVAVYPAGLAALAFLVTPHGHLPSTRWRWLGWAGAAVTLLLVVLIVTALGDPAEPHQAGPVAVVLLVEGPVGLLALLAGLGVLGAAGGSVVIRLRRATGEERLQLRWIASGGAVAILANSAVTLLAILFLPRSAAEFAITLATTLSFGVVVPASFAIAIVRYRLYDLDLLLNRTVLYGAVAAVLAAVLSTANLVAQQLAESVIGRPSGLATAALGVIAGMTFGPLHRAVRPIVDYALPPRGELTLLFIDIVESTQAIVDLGDENWHDLLLDFRAVVRRELARRAGAR